ncbi:MAG: tetratricopeptide repeat protein [Candidatus Delongbacteria bacterium]|nr:tetratricopeptide repeat protein [Candidatus Delongbacteria bacterium]
MGGLYREAFSLWEFDEKYSINGLLSFQLGMFLHDNICFKEAETLLRYALEVDENSCGPNHPDVARDLHMLAELLRETNRKTEAELLIHRALKINEKYFGQNHPDVASISTISLHCLKKRIVYLKPSLSMAGHWR